MRILYHHRTLADGAEGIHIAEMVSAFRALGHDVRVLGLAADDAPPARRAWLTRVRERLPAPLLEAAAVATNALEYVQTRRAIRAFAPDFVYKRHARNDVGAIYAARHEGRPVVLEVNCLFTGTRYQRFEPIALEGAARFLEKRALRAATTRLAVSSPLAGDIKRLADVEAIVMPNGADPERFDPARAAASAVRERYGLADGLVVGWIGVIREWHGLELLLDALPHIHGVRVLVVGDGPGKAALRVRADALGLADRITITGLVPHREMPHYIAAMDIAVIASDQTRVASPMKLLEYMSMGRAVVAPALPNIEDIVTHAVNGWLFAPNDAADLGEALRMLAGNEPLRRRLGAAARRTIVDDRNWRRIAERVLKALPAPAGASVAEPAARKTSPPQGVH